MTGALVRLHHASKEHRFRWIFIAGVPWLALAAWGATTGVPLLAYLAAAVVFAVWLVGMLAGPYLLVFGTAVAMAALVAWRKGGFAGFTGTTDFVVAGGAGILALLLGGALVGSGSPPVEQAETVPPPAPVDTSGPTPSTTSSTQPAVTTTSTTPVSLEAESVTDGDTFRVRIDGTSEAVRIIGIDAPELGDCLADEATARLEELLAPGFQLRTDVSNRDGFGRLLRSVEVAEGDVAAILVAEGFAISRRYPPDLGGADRLDELHLESLAATRGIWSWETCGAPVLELATAGTALAVRNAGTGTLSLGGMAVSDGSEELYVFPATAALLPAEEIAVAPGCATDGGRRLYACVGTWTGLLTIAFADDVATAEFPPATTTTTATSTTRLSAGSPLVEVSGLRLNADGNDNENKNDEWVEVTNRGPGAADLTGWSIEDEGANHRLSFPSGFGLDEQATVRIRSGCGTPTDTELFWCNSGSAVWNNNGDTAFLFDAEGELVDSR